MRIIIFLLFLLLLPVAIADDESAWAPPRQVTDLAACLFSANPDSGSFVVELRGSWAPGGGKGVFVGAPSVKERAPGYDGYVVMVNACNILDELPEGPLEDPAGTDNLDTFSSSTL